MLAAAVQSTVVPGLQEALVAVAVAAAVGLLAFPFARWSYWRRWWRRWWLGLAAYLGVNAVAGLVGWLLAAITSWAPAGNALVDGVAYGAVGQALLRVDYQGFGFGKVKQTTTALGKASDWVVSMLNDQAKLGVGAHCDKLDDYVLLAQGYRVWALEVDPDEDVPEKAKRKIVKALDKADNDLSDASLSVRQRAQETLRATCILWANERAMRDFLDE